MDLGLRNALENFSMAWDLAQAAGLSSMHASWFGPDDCICFSTSQWDKGVIRLFMSGTDGDSLSMCVKHYGLVGQVRKSNSHGDFAEFYFEGYYKDGQPWIDPTLLDAAISAKAVV